MFKELNYKTSSSQAESKEIKRSKKMLEDCQKVIKQLQSELQYALQQNQEKDQIIRLLSEEKDFYEQQSRKNDQKLFPKLKDQLTFNQSLVNGLKQYNKELTQKNILLDQENKELWQTCNENDQILRLTQQNIVKLQQEKSKLQREWSSTLKCVKMKIFEIQQENYNLDQHYSEQQINKKRAFSKGAQKRNLNSKQQKNKKIVSQPNQNRNDSKVQEVLKEIDIKLLNYEFLDMIQSKELRKQIQDQDKSEANKQNISDNINRKALEKNEQKYRKIPILKLSELNLNQDSL